mmetsp:Transcript_45321/g.75203  ORF Transcript_45321/g.75203 Transcript_45321/m.75203 type:complete len:295 (+) Transcript_45321:32-916(+)
MSIDAITNEIRSAYSERDAEKSRKLHESKSPASRSGLRSAIEDDGDSIIVETTSEQGHKDMGDYVKSIIYGGLDGVTTTFAIVSAIAGARLSSPQTQAQTILVLGFATLIASGLSMGIGEFFSETSELEYINREKRREMWEFDNFKEGEIQEMIDIYRRKGISAKDAQIILQTMSKYKDFFVDHMMVQELNMQPPSGNEQPLKSGLVTLFSFLVFGFVPLLSYIFFQHIEFDSYDPKFVISCAVTGVTFFILGVFKAKITETSVMKSAIVIMVNGYLSALSAYVIAYGISEMFL